MTALEKLVDLLLLKVAKLDNVSWELKIYLSGLLIGPDKGEIQEKGLMNAFQRFHGQHFDGQ